MFRTFQEIGENRHCFESRRSFSIWIKDGDPEPAKDQPPAQKLLTNIKGNVFQIQNITILPSFVRVD